MRSICLFGGRLQAQLAQHSLLKLNVEQNRNAKKKKLARFNGEMRKTAPSYIFFLFNFFCSLDHKTTRVQFTNRKNYWLKES